MRELSFQRWQAEVPELMRGRVPDSRAPSPGVWPSLVPSRLPMARFGVPRAAWRRFLRDRAVFVSYGRSRRYSGRVGGRRWQRYKWRAKFGIWVHFSPQAAGESGDWYARKLYVPGTRANQNHLKRYSHPSEAGLYWVKTVLSMPLALTVPSPGMILKIESLGTNEIK